MRSTLATIRQSRLPEDLGICTGDIPALAKFVNEAQQRLINLGGETGWWGGWGRAYFNTTFRDPYLTLPREFARLINLDVCANPIRIHNEFFEFLPGGVGMQHDTTCSIWAKGMAGYDRGTVATMVDIPSSNQLVRAYITDSRDSGKRILVTGLDQNGNPLYCRDTFTDARGIFLTLTDPMVTSTMIVTSIQAIQKDPTYGDVVLKAVDATTGAETLLARYGPDETMPSYRRYVITKFPTGCCGCTQAVTTSTASTVPILGDGASEEILGEGGENVMAENGVNSDTFANASPTCMQLVGIVKLEFVPAWRDTDPLIIGNVPALIEECLAIKYGRMDDTNAGTLEDRHHAKAVRLLQDELRHYVGETKPSVTIDLRHGLRNDRVGLLV